MSACFLKILNLNSKKYWVNKLQEDVYGKLRHFHMMTPDEQIDHVDKLTQVVRLRKIMYTRLSDQMIQMQLL